MRNRHFSSGARSSSSVASLLSSQTAASDTGLTAVTEDNTRVTACKTLKNNALWGDTE